MTAVSVAFAHTRVVVDDRVLIDVPNLTIAESFVSVIGPNGGGKSTLLQLMNSLVEPSFGSVHVAGLDTIDDGAKVRALAGYVFSNPAAQLVMPTPAEDVALSLQHRVRDRDERRERALACLTQLGIADLADRSSHEISAGQQQLVALATVIVQQPQLLLLDEPTTLLDLSNARRFMRIVEQLRQIHDIRVVVATHDLELAATAQRTLLVDDGQIVADGEPEAVIDEYRRRSA